MKQLTLFLRKDGWLLALMLVCIAACLWGNTSGGRAGTSEEEARIARVLSAMEGAGTVEVAVFYRAGEAPGQEVPSGAVVVADGAGDVGVQLKLRRAVMTLLGLDAEAIGVYAREGK